MTTKIYEDSEGRQITEYMSPDGLKLELWADPWKLSPDDAHRIGDAMVRWAFRCIAAEQPGDKKWNTWP